MKRRIILGKGEDDGVIETKQQKGGVEKKIINGTYIDLGKLKNNIISVRYVSTCAMIPTVKVWSISNDVKEIIEDIINKKYDKRLYGKRTLNNKRLNKRIVTALKLDIDVHDKSDEEYQRQFEITLGEFESGNSNPLIKHKLKQYVMESMESGHLPRREAFKIMFELANA